MASESVQRTMRFLKAQGVICAVVEKWNAYAGEHGIRQDLFGIIDIIALDTQKGVRGIQCCGQDFKAHIDKIYNQKTDETIAWLETPGTTLEIWGWRKVKLQRGGKAERWSPRVQVITLDDFNGETGLVEEEI